MKRDDLQRMLCPPPLFTDLPKLCLVGGLVKEPFIAEPLLPDASPFMRDFERMDPHQNDVEDRQSSLLSSSLLSSLLSSSSLSSSLSSSSSSSSSSSLSSSLSSSSLSSSLSSSFVRPLVLVDGHCASNEFREYFIKEKLGAVVPLCRGDGRSYSIAAAGNLAKVVRDDVMMILAEMYPRYGLERNKGYCSAASRADMVKYGLCPFHRRSYEPCAAALLERAAINEREEEAGKIKKDDNRKKGQKDAGKI